MAALRALLFAVFGGFIGAAPAAPVVPDRAGHDAGEAGACTHSQKSEHGGYGAEAPATRECAAAPPSSDTGTPATGMLPPSCGFRLPAAAPAPSGSSPGPRPRPPAEDVRAGLLDLPPPPR